MPALAPVAQRHSLHSRPPPVSLSSFNDGNTELQEAILEALGSIEQDGTTLYRSVAVAEDELSFAAAIAGLAKSGQIERKNNTIPESHGLARYVYKRISDQEAETSMEPAGDVAATADMPAAVTRRDQRGENQETEGKGRPGELQATRVVAETATAANRPTLGTILETNETLSVDVPRLLTTGMFIQAASGGGKSWALRRLLEQTAPLVHQIVIDPEGEFSTLVTGYPYVVFGSEAGNLPLSQCDPGELAEELMRTRVSAILDLSDMDWDERDEFVAEFLRGLMRVSPEHWHHTMVVVDEAHLFAPQHDKSVAKKPMIDLAGRGRKRGLRPVMATQRLSKLNKSVAAELHNRMIGMTVLDVDVRRSADELGIPVGKANEILAALKPGEFLVYGPALCRRVSHVKVGPVDTKHGHLVGDVCPPVIPTVEITQRLVAITSPLPVSQQPEPMSDAQPTTTARGVVTINRPNVVPLSTVDGKRIVEHLLDNVNKARATGQCPAAALRDLLLYELLNVLALPPARLLEVDVNTFDHGCLPIRDWTNVEGASDANEAEAIIRAHIDGYARDVRPMFPFQPGDALFLSQRGTRLSYQSAQAHLQRTLRDVGLDGKGYSLGSFGAE